MRGYFHQAPLGEIRIDESSGINPIHFPDETFELYSVPSFESGKPEIVIGKEIGSNKQIVEKNVVLLCKINPHINRVWTVGDFSENKKIASTEWISFYPHGAIDQEYLNYFFQSHSFRDYLIHNVSGVGGSLMRIKPSVIADYSFPIPPLNEQARIVAKLEELFTKLDAGCDALKQIQKQIKRYRQAVLRDAVTGELTKAWREENQADLEPAANLLKRILTMRRERWEQEQLKKFTETGKTPKNDDWKKKYKEPAAPNTENLPELPKEWTWINFDGVSFVTKLAGFEFTKFITYIPDGDLPVIKAENVSKTGFRKTNFSFVDSKSVIKLTRSIIIPNDLLMVFVGAGLGQVGRVPDDKKYFLGPNVALIRLTKDLLIPKFVEMFLRSTTGFDLTFSLSKATAQGSISMGQIRLIPCIVPPLAEQQKIVEEVEWLLSVADAVEATVKQSLKQAERLRQSILKRAFEGKLVPQDDADEPAQILLERIKQEREEKASETKAQKVKAKKPKTRNKNSIQGDLPY